MPQIANDILAYMTGFLGLVVWGIRLEGKVKNTEEKVDKLYHLEDRISDIRDSLARIEGRLGINRHD